VGDKKASGGKVLTEGKKLVQLDPQKGGGAVLKGKEPGSKWAEGKWRPGVTIDGLRGNKGAINQKSSIKGESSKLTGKESHLKGSLQKETRKKELPEGKKNHLIEIPAKRKVPNLRAFPQNFR